MDTKICVIGAGIVGLHTATLFQEAHPGGQVTVFADQFLTETTSDGAAGIFRSSNNFQGETPQQTDKWLTDSYNRYNSYLRDTEHAKTIGIKEINGYFLSSRGPQMVENKFLKKVSRIYRSCTNEELESFKFKPKYGTYLTTLLIECRRFLPFLQKKLLANGGKLVQRHIESFEEISNEGYDIVFNCSGLGSQKLCSDTCMVPLRGQVFKVEAPWVDKFLYADLGTYIIPGFDAITLGGVRQFEDYNTDVAKGDSESIMTKCVAALPSLKNAKVVREWVGLRPHRGTVRVEAELMKFPTGTSMIVVHNYGHGGYGVMTAPGTSLEAVEKGVNLVKNRKQTYKAKL